ncbi:uncharacterized protein KY384_009099 [Bacidia gigantensis]|uniref:uncharacterized protein n=1 Tax=Bacidia gigantensis TaxID=2732470 RepID=UPI001D04B676|nr:uncharacterized protein KY384_009099 [Bacidia gigantensis]KAG8525455.1 hypothetical protein KY384_009099 [Bacidia gigantensis]
MSGLVGYGSSEGEEDEVSIKVETPEHVDTALALDTTLEDGRAAPPSISQTPLLPPPEPTNGAATLGPTTGPYFPHAFELVPATSRSQSPYTSNRDILRTLTLPENPNLDIPPSPPASPPPGNDIKIYQFLKLKAQGVHFNAKLAASSALKNPSLLPKLMAAAGLDEEDGGRCESSGGRGGNGVQYATTLSKELWDPDGWPEWAYTEELDKVQEDLRKRREQERVGSERAFVPAIGVSSERRAGGIKSVKREGLGRKWDERELKRRK